MAVLIIAAIGFLAVPSPASVVVTGINFQSPDNACGLDGATDSGFDAGESQSVGFSYRIYGVNTTSGNGTLACVLAGINTSTPGFAINGANVPLSIPANASQIFSFNLVTPSSPYTGVLTLILS